MIGKVCNVPYRIPLPARGRRTRSGTLRRRIELSLSLPIARLDAVALQTAVRDIGIR